VRWRSPVKRSPTRTGHSNNFKHRPAEARRHREAGASSIDGLNAANLDRFPNTKSLLINVRFPPRRSGSDTVVGRREATLYLMWGGRALRLLIGCVNVANLVPCGRARGSKSGDPDASGPGGSASAGSGDGSVLLTLFLGRDRVARWLRPCSGSWAR